MQNSATTLRSNKSSSTGTSPNPSPSPSPSTSTSTSTSPSPSTGASPSTSKRQRQQRQPQKKHSSWKDSNLSQTSNGTSRTFSTTDISVSPNESSGRPKVVVSIRKDMENKNKSSSSNNNNSNEKNQQQQQQQQDDVSSTSISRLGSSHQSLEIPAASLSSAGRHQNRVNNNSNNNSNSNSNNIISYASAATQSKASVRSLRLCKDSPSLASQQGSSNHSRASTSNIVVQVKQQNHHIHHELSPSQGSPSQNGWAKIRPSLTRIDMVSPSREGWAKVRPSVTAKLPSGSSSSSSSSSSSDSEYSANPLHIEAGMSSSSSSSSDASSSFVESRDFDLSTSSASNNTLNDNNAGVVKKVAKKQPTTKKQPATKKQPITKAKTKTKPANANTNTNTNTNPKIDNNNNNNSSRSASRSVASQKSTASKKSTSSKSATASKRSVNSVSSKAAGKTTPTPTSTTTTASTSASVSSNTSRGRDMMHQLPQRRSTFDEDEDGQDYEDDDDDDSSSSSSSCSYNDEEDFNVDDDSNDVIMPSVGTASVGTASFSASYGSLSLGGDASLSSADTFNNSPTPINAALLLQGRDSIPDLSASPRRSIMKLQPPVVWKRRRYYSSDEDSEATSSSQASSSSSASDDNSNSNSNSDLSSSASSHETGLKSAAASGGKNKKRLSRGYESGDVSIATYGTDNLMMDEADPEDSISSLPSYPPIYHPDDSTIMQDDSSTVQFEDPPISTYSVSDDKSQTHSSKNNVKLKKPNSYGSWTSSDNWCAPKSASDHWASQETKFRPRDLGAWTSGDDDSSISIDDESEDRRPTRKQNNNNRNNNNRKASERIRSDPQRPRSGYDKNAPWYCGEDGSVDGVQSVNSDGSSVLSIFKKKKNKKTTSPPVATAASVPQSDASMSFSDLIQPKSAAATGTTPADQSMSLGDLQGGPSQRQQKQSLEIISLRDLKPESEKKKKAKPKSARPVKAKSKSNRKRRAPPIDEEAGENESSPPNKNNDTADDSALSNRTLRHMMFIGLALFLIFDIVLLSVFLSRRGGDEDNAGTLPAGVWATVPETICWDWVPGQGKSQLCTPEDTAQGGGVANLLAKAIYATSPEPVDLSLIPAGLTQGDIPKGDFTVETAESVLQQARRLRRLQNDSLVMVLVTGEQITRVLEHSLKDSLQGKSSSSYPYASGMRYSVDDGPSSSHRVFAPVMSNNGAWGALEPGKEYTMITTADWANAYLQLQGVPMEMTPLAALTDYAKQEKVLEIPEFSTRKFFGSHPGTETDNGAEPPGNVADIINDGSSMSLATVEEDICLDWLPGQGLSTVCSKEETAAQGGGVCNLVAWGLLSELESRGGETEIFLLNADECQTDLLQGPFEEEQIQALLPKNHEVVQLTLTGEQLVLALEEAIDFVLESAANVGSYPYAGGLRFVVNPNVAVGQRVSEMEWFSRERWKSINLARVYAIATTYPLAEGEGGYTNLLNAIGRTDTSLLTRAIFLDYVKDAGTLTNLPSEKYSTQEYVRTSP